MNLKKTIILFIIISLSSLLTSYILIQNIKNKIVVKDNTYYLLNKNTSKKNILSQLKTNNINISRLNWLFASFIHKNSFVPKAGEYIIPKDSTILDIQRIFHEGKTLTRKFTLIDGSTAVELKNELLNNPYLSGKVKDLKEGIYKPDTYFFKFGYPRNKLLAQMQKAQEKFLDEIWENRPTDFVLKNKNELLILASIIQKESNNINDSKLVASVFINRLNNQMKLQSDVTLAYGFRINGKKITKKMLKSNNLYNTYKHYGLPPTPISYPGKNALISLKNPKKTNYFYFVSDGNGRHRFSKTYSLHKRNIELWKKIIRKK